MALHAMRFQYGLEQPLNMASGCSSDLVLMVQDGPLLLQ